LLALIERPVEHGPSPRMRGASFVADGLNCVCVALNVEPEYLPAAVKGAAAFGLRGINITVSHKRAMPPLLDLEPPRLSQLRLECSWSF
jgi:shikimate dehydrogenase